MSRSSAPHIGTLIVMTATTVVTTNMFLPALPAMQEDFGVSTAVIGLAISGAMISAAIMQLMIGPLSDRFGRRPVVIWGLIAYVLASFVATMAQDIAVFLAARMAQSVIAVGAVTASAVVRDTSEGSDAAARLATISAAMAVAPMLAPMLGGFLDTWFGWRAIFWTYTGLGACLLALVIVDLKETKVRAAQMASPAVLLREPLFWALVGTFAFSIGGFFTFISGVALVAAAAYGLGSDIVGLGIGIITGGYMVGSTVSARMVRRYGTWPLIAAGRCSALLGPSVGLLLMWTGMSHPLVLFGASIFVGIGNGLTIMNANAEALEVRPDLAGTASGIIGAATLALGAVLTTLALTALDAAPTPERLLGLILGVVALSALCAIMARKLSRRARH